MVLVVEGREREERLKISFVSLHQSEGTWLDPLVELRKTWTTGALKGPVATLFIQAELNYAEYTCNLI